MSIRLAAIAVVATAAMASSTQAADLMIDAVPEVVDTSFVNSVYVQLLGGVALPGEVQYYDDGDPQDAYDTLAGYAVAGTLGVVVMDGLSVEADAFYSRREEDNVDLYIYETASLMANVKGTVALNDTFSVYGAAGVGMIWAVNDAFEYSGLGYQLIAGVSAKLTDNVSGVLEARYQDGFSPLVDSNDEAAGFSVPVAAVLAGVKFSF